MDPCSAALSAIARGFVAPLLAGRPSVPPPAAAAGPRQVVMVTMERHPALSLADLFPVDLAPTPPVGLAPEERAQVMAAIRPVALDGSDGSGCVICCEDWAAGAEVVPLRCGHCLHPACLAPWLDTSRTCPCCRAPSV